MKMRVKAGDTVVVRVGKDRGKTGKIVRAFPSAGRVLVENVNMVVRHRKPRRQGEKGQTVSLPAPLSVSNVKPICSSCKQAVRVSRAREGKSVVRHCKKCGASL